MPLPDEGLVQLRPTGTEVSLDRRRSPRGGPPAMAPEWLASVELEERVPPRPPRIKLASAVGTPALFAPLKNAARALEPAFVAAKAVGEKLQQRTRIDPAQLVAEGEVLEAAGEAKAAFAAYGSALLAAPLDATPVRALERLAGAERLRLALADLYEQVVAAAEDHPSAATLLRRAAQLRDLAEAGGDSGASWAEIAGLLPAAQRPSRAVPPPAGAAVRVPAPDADASAAAAQPERGPVRLAEAAALGTVLAKWTLTPGPAAAPAVAAGEAPERSALAPRASVGDTPGGEAAPAAKDEEIDGSIAARTVPLIGRQDPTAPTVGARLLAWAIDAAVVLAVPLAAFAAATVGFARPGVSWIDQAIHLASQSRSLLAASLLLGLLTAFVYLTLGVTFGGKTLGDRAAGLRSVAVDHGGAPDFATAALRSAVAIAGTLAFLAGPLWALVDPKGQTLHDKVAGTRTQRC